LHFSIRGGHYVRFELRTLVDLDDSSPAAMAQLKKETRAMLDLEASRLKFIADVLARPRPTDCAYRTGANYVRPEGPRVRKKDGADGDAK
jgi:hypothetical protein